MKVIHVGSKNQTKIDATVNILCADGLFEGADVKGIDVNVEEFGHPKTIDETVRGAKDRAKAAYEGSILGVGLESGLIRAAEADMGYLETTVCALYDGERYSIGMSPSFQWPRKMLDLILGGLDGSQAFKQLGLTNHEKIGTAEGAIYTLTHGKVNRTKLNELAITMALLQLENPEHY